MAVDLSSPTLPYMAPISLSTAANEITIGTGISAVYIYIDDASGGLCASDASNYGPIVGQVWELIYSRPVIGSRDSTIQVKVASGTPSGYLRAF